VEIEQAKRMPAPAEAVFDVVSDVSRLHDWLPTVESAQEEGPDLVHVAGDRGGHHYDADSLFRAERDQLRVEWGTRGQGDYAGWLQIYSHDDGTSEVNIHLSFFDELDHAVRGRRADEVEAELDAALDRLATQVSA
jgi:uncharacterized protein YndB with AHSA1/START domain